MRVKVKEAEKASHRARLGCAGERRVEFVALGANEALFEGELHRTPGFVEMSAVEESTAFNVARNVGHGAQNVEERQVGKPELLKARRVDDGARAAAAGEIVPTRGGRCLTSEVERFGKLSRRRFGIRNEQIEDRRLAHT